MDTNQFRQFLIENNGKPRAWLAKATGRSTRTINEHQQRLEAEGLIKRDKGQGVKRVELTPEQQFQLDLEKVRSKDSESSKKYRAALQEIVRLRSDMEALTAVRSTPTTYVINGTKSKRHNAVAFAIASDWHVFENVDPESVDGTNEYTSAIAKKRAEAFFRNTLKLIQKEQQDAHIDTLVLALLGDFISGNINDELMESCEGPPADEAIFAQSLLASGVRYLLANSKLNIVVPCCVGNHSRITSQVHVSKEQGNSLEWMIYKNLADLFKGEKRVKFVLSRSYFTFVEVFGYAVRFHHGHAIKYGGGIGGLTIPVVKAIARYDLDRKAYLDVMGHFHQKFDGGKFIINGCLIGNTPYGKRLGFTGKPEQVFFLVDEKAGKTIVAPIFTE